MGQTNLHDSLDFPGSLTPLWLHKFAWSPQHKTYYFNTAMDRGIKIVRNLK